MKEVKDFLLNDISLKDDDYVVVAVSGGPDSMALLNILLYIKKDININLVCAHINHNVRKESEEEKIFVEEYCKKNSIVFEYMKIEKYTNNIFSESEARNIRYDFFDKLMKKYNSKVLLTAHHGDDLIETILMRLVRGSTLKGYAGFPKISEINGYKIVRPLISCTKEDIEEYNSKNNIPFLLDASNNKDDYTRNRYRHKVLPFLKEEDQNVNTKFLKYSELLLEYNNYVDREMMKSLDKVFNNKILDINKYLKLENLIQKRILNYILEIIYSDDLSLVGDTHIESIQKLIKSNKANAQIKLPNNVKVIKSYNTIIFKNKDNDNVSLSKKELSLKDETLWNKHNKFMLLREADVDSNYICRLNNKDISLPLYLRTKADGDKISVKGLNGKKKVKNVFIDSKIPIKDRNNWPILVDSNDNILWLPGIKKSKYNKDKNEKCDIIIKYIIEEEK